MGEEKRISVRVDQSVKDRLKEVQNLTGLPESVIVKECLFAFLDHVEKHGHITLPLKIVPKNATVQYHVPEDDDLKVAE